MRLGVPELLVILFIILLIFGANRVPQLMRGIGKGVKEFKDATKEEN
jgi:sec-independent protein translocase protein TatA